MDRGVDIPWVGGFKIPWVDIPWIGGVKIPWVGGQNTMGKGLKYHG